MCGALTSGVWRSRQRLEDVERGWYRRERKCAECGARWHTYELHEYDPAIAGLVVHRSPPPEPKQT